MINGLPEWKLAVFLSNRWAPIAERVDGGQAATKSDGGETMKILVIGGSFGRLTTAYDLRRLLPRRERDITVISKKRHFIFIPSPPWVAMGQKSLADIYFNSAAVSKITDSSVELADGKVFESRFSLIIPPLAGVRAIADSPALGNPKGFIPVDGHYRHIEFANIYAVGVAVALPPVEETQVRVNFPKTGHMTEQMAKIAARNIAADIQGDDLASHDLMAERIMDMGDQAGHVIADPIRPPRNVSEMSKGKRWLWAKRFFANYYLWKMRHGATWSPKWVWQVKGDGMTYSAMGDPRPSLNANRQAVHGGGVPFPLSLLELQQSRADSQGVGGSSQGAVE